MRTLSCNSSSALFHFPDSQHSAPAVAFSLIRLPGSFCRCNYGIGAGIIAPLVSAPGFCAFRLCASVSAFVHAHAGKPRACSIYLSLEFEAKVKCAVVSPNFQTFSYNFFPTKSVSFVIRPVCWWPLTDANRGCEAHAVRSKRGTRRTQEALITAPRKKAPHVYALSGVLRARLSVYPPVGPGAGL